MLRGVALQVVPEVLRQHILRIRRRLKNRAEPRGAVRKRRELKPDLAAEPPPIKADHEDSLPVLRHPVPRINNLMVQLIVESIEFGLDYPPSVPAVVGSEVLYVLQKQNAWALGSSNVADFEEEIALPLAAETMRLAEGVSSC